VMELRYVGHACLYLDTGHDRILMDPWFDRPAYLNQWRIHPSPTDHAALADATAILISHGHEDHLHLPTLKRCNRTATIYSPMQYEPGARTLFEKTLGFGAFVEMVGGRKYSLPGGTRVSPIAVGHDAVLMIESGGTVIANVNDALHSASIDVIDRV